MSFGGSVQAMITALKNNEKMRSKRDKFKRPLNGSYAKVKPEYDFPEATPEMLQSIKERIVKEDKRIKIKVIALTIILFLGLVLSFYYFIL